MNEHVAVLHVIASLDTTQGGPSRTVTALVDALSSETCLDVMLLTQSRKGISNVRSRSALVERHECSSESGLAMRLGLPLKQALHRLAQPDRFQVIHSHGLWLPVNHWACRAARQRALPLIIHPRGMLGPWALQHRAWKKRLVMALYQRTDLKSASVIVATSDDEYRNVRTLGFANPVAVIPNGIVLPELEMQATHARDNARSRTVLFLSRIHKVKGLINLVRAWSSLQSVGWRLHIVGPDTTGHLQEVMKEAKQLGIDHLIDFTGEVNDSEKAAMYKNADIFVLPSFSENFGVVVAEALAYGLPVITTTGTPWSDLNTYGCGWSVDIGVEPLRRALSEAMQLDDVARKAMGRRGIEYVQHFDWTGIAHQTADVYRWALGQGAKPDCVHLD